MNISQISILCFLGFIVLLFYYIFLIKDSKYDYVTHPFWFNMNVDVVRMLIFFQLFAVIGFIFTVTSWIINPPSQGIVNGNNLFYILSIFLISAAIWPVATYYKIHWLVIISLVITAISSIFLLAGTIEEKSHDVRWYKVLGMLCLCLVTVLGDGVLWNANYIKYKL
jgi:hypothetical protein